MASMVTFHGMSEIWKKKKKTHPKAQMPEMRPWESLLRPRASVQL